MVNITVNREHLERLLRAVAASYLHPNGGLACRDCSETGNWPCSLCDVHAAGQALAGELHAEGPEPEEVEDRQPGCNVCGDFGPGLVNGSGRCPKHR